MATPYHRAPVSEGTAADRQRSGSGEYGIAVLLVVACLAVLMPFTASFNYQARVDWQSAVNLRDEVAARQTQRGGLRLSVLLFELQRMVFNQKQFRDMMGTWDITQVAPYLMSVFGSKDGAEGLGGMVGLDTSALSELAFEDAGTFEVRLEAESGKLNVNCLGQNAVGKANPAGMTAETLESMMAPVLYNPLFEEEKADGRFYTREDIVRAMTDYIDDNLQRFDVVQLKSGSTQESDQYEQLPDPYAARNSRLDSIEELHLVRGIDDDWMTAFGSELTVYGTCKINLNFASAQQIALVLRYAVSGKDKWKTEGENFLLKTLPLANYIVQSREFNLFPKLENFKEIVGRPDEFVNPLLMMAGSAEDQVGNLPKIPEGMEIRVNAGKNKEGDEWNGIKDIATVSPERFYRVEIITEMGAVRKRVTAVYDMQFARKQSQGKGAWLYYRED